LITAQEVTGLNPVMVTNKSKASKIIKLAFLILKGFDFQSGALSGSAKLLLNIKEKLFYVSPSLLECFFCLCYFQGGALSGS
jgi:hypothetical protein